MAFVDQGSRTGIDGSDEFAQVFVERVQVRNFRGIAKCEVYLEPGLTLLVGANNAGKTRILRALQVALGASAADRDDLTVGGSAEAEIDVVLAPSPTNDTGDTFGERASRRLEPGIQTVSEDPPVERFAWRTTIKVSHEGFGVRADHHVASFDAKSGEWVLPELPLQLNFYQRSVISCAMAETRRDLVEELARRGSPVRRVLDDLDIDPAKRQALETRLSGLGDEILDSSGSLAAIKDALQLLTDAVDGVGAPSLQPLPVRLEELARSVSIDLDTGGGGLPIRLHGAGARSLASLQVQSVLYERRLGQDGLGLRPHPVTLIEEPEAHLHPQAQFELSDLLGKIRGQNIVSTHSAHLVSVVDPKTIRLLRRAESETTVVDLHPAEDDESADDRARKPSLHFEEMERLRRQVERPFGELLFASAIIMGDGATERALLPPLARYKLGARAHGLCVVDPGSMGSPQAIAVVKFAKFVGLPWILFADSDESGVRDARRLDSDYGDGDESHIVWVPGPPADGVRGHATEQMFFEFDPELCISACVPLGFTGTSDDVFGFMTDRKGALGRLLAAELIDRNPWVDGESVDPWPTSLCTLMERLDTVLPRRESTT